MATKIAELGEELNRERKERGEVERKLQMVIENGKRMMIAERLFLGKENGLMEEEHESSDIPSTDNAAEAPKKKKKTGKKKIEKKEWAPRW